MDTNLFEYGIKQEQSDIRCHVCPASKAVYVYRTKAVLDLIENRTYDEVTVGASGNLTARGIALPIGDIPDLRCIPIPEKTWRQIDIKPTDSTTVKGQKAQKLVERLCEYGRFPVWCKPKVISDLKQQYAGIDLTVDAQARIQVKCDLRGGHKEAGGTGNLFIQLAEANPHKQH